MFAAYLWSYANSSDHTNLNTREREKNPSLSRNKMNWNMFREELDELITLEVPLKTKKKKPWKP
jgi:hypothetical protein